MTEVVLVSGRDVLVDDEGLALLRGGGWIVKINNGNPYVGRNIHDGRRVVRHEVLHRILMRCPDDRMVDHINGNTLDNRRVNLRICDHAENMKNRRIHSNNRSGVKGVYRDATEKNIRWRAQIRVEGKKICIGSFASPEEAEAAYLEASKRYHGEFSRSPE